MRNARRLRTVAGDLGPYILGQRLGVGGMGVVYEAMCLKLGAHVAVKFLHPDRSNDERARRRFDDERIAGRVVAHPNVVAMLDTGTTDDGAPFLVMERVLGEPLGVRIAREGRMSPVRAVAIARQILAALATIHDAGVVHADVKSDNVLVAARGDGTDVCKLIDFGLARVQFATKSSNADGQDSRDQWLSGTPEYMAPEVIRGAGSSFSADLYAVGIILYEMLTGSTPFAGGTAAEIVHRHLDDEAVPPSLRCPELELPSTLDDLVLRALQKAESERIHSARAFDAALASVELELARTTWDRDEVAIARRRAPRCKRETPTLVCSHHKRLGRG